MSRILRWAVIVWMILLPISSCGQNKTESKTDVINPQLEKNVQLWREKRICNYRFEVNKFEGTANFMQSRIQIRNCKVASHGIIGEKPMSNYQEIDDFETVDGAFDLLRNAYEHGAGVVVTYNEDFGYPEKFGITPRGSYHAQIFRLINFDIIKNE